MAGEVVAEALVAESEHRVDAFPRGLAGEESAQSFQRQLIFNLIEQLGVCIDALEKVRVKPLVKGAAHLFVAKLPGRIDIKMAGDPVDSSRPHRHAERHFRAIADSRARDTIRTSSQGGSSRSSAPGRACHANSSSRDTSNLLEYSTRFIAMHRRRPGERRCVKSSENAGG